MDRKDKNIKPGDSEIVTKKGFLITPPAHKNKKLSYRIEAENAEDRKEQKEQKANKQKQQNDNSGETPRPQRNKDGKRNRFDNRNKKNFQKPQQEKTEQKKDISPAQPQSNEAQKSKNQDKRNERRQNGRKNGDQRRQNRPQEQKVQNEAGKSAKNQKEKHPAEERKSVLGDLGFSSGAFFKKTKKEPVKAEEEAPEEKIDYSKAIPLRDQIYPPKKEKPALTEADKEGKTEIIGVRFKEAGKIYYFDPDSKEVSYGTPVIVETARGLEYGYTAISNRYVPGESIIAPLKKIVRIATNSDRERLEANKMLEKQAEGIFIEKVAKLGLEMTLVGVEYTFDNTKLLFYFSSDGRIDFRELVKELASVFRTRIELRQVGVRDEAKLLGGLGICGRPLCCKTFLGEFAQVSIKMAKDQSLSLNSSKISGTCGRLLCCLRYEDEVYQQEYERTPKVDAIVETPEGKGVVVETNPLKGVVKVRLDSKKDSPPQPFKRDDVKILGYLKRNDSAEDAELKELEKE